MKIFTIIYFISFSLMALPVLNEGVSTNSLYTIYHDHLDKNLYYITPKYMGIAEKDGEPLISYTEYYVSRRRVNAILNVILIVKNYEDELWKAKENILRENKNAKFSLIPFSESYVKIVGTYETLVFSHECDHLGAEHGGELGCTFKLNSLGAYTFKKSIHKPTAFLVNFQYSIAGVNLIADGTYSNVTKELAIAGRIGGSNLLNFPHLFTNAWGDPIDFSNI